MSSVRVPVEPKKIPVGSTYSDRMQGYVDGWNECLKAMLAAAPASPPVEGLVGRLNDEASKQITFSSDLTAPYVGQLLREAATALTAIPAREDVIEECAKICEDAAIEWLASCDEGSEQQAYEDVVLRNAAHAIRALLSAEG